VVDFLVELVLFVFRLLHIELPDCAQLFSDVVKRKRLAKGPPKVYVWLCQLLGAASAMRVTALLLFFCILALLLWHFEPRWPFFDFSNEARERDHYLYLSTTSTGAGSPIHYCEVLALISMTAFVSVVLSFRALGWVSEVMVREFFPLRSEVPTDPKSKLRPK
jgi:hypothetical protein